MNVINLSRKYSVELINKCSNADFSSKSLNASGGGTGCAACTVIVQVINNYVKKEALNITDFVFNVFCKLFPQALQPTCKKAMEIIGPEIIDSFINGHNSDYTCNKVGYCTDAQCHLNPKKQTNSFFQNINYNGDKEMNNQLIPPWQWLIDLINKFANQHLPLIDLDGDYFSVIPTFRGNNWRGFDCDENNNKIYPGRKQYTGINKGVDYNCNGIHGVNPQTNKPYKHEFCDNTDQIGIAVVGDSAGAHFSIPESWLNVTMFNGSQYNDILYVASNELDWPHRGGYTGKLPDDPLNPLKSIYKKLVERNRCNFNDYQNVAVNGGASGSTYQTIKALARDKYNDHPLLVFLEVIGNDICIPKDLDKQRKPAEFRVNILKLLEYLDSVLPKGSHVFIFGLVDGNILWDNLHQRIHPLNVTYESVYSLLNCLKISPCWGWLNSNETIRNISSQHAESLNQVYRDIKNEQRKYLNFDYDYYDFPSAEIFDKYIQEGGDPINLIEQVDGFHPNQRFNSYLADWIWNKLLLDHPSWIGKINERNEHIDRMFQQKFQQQEDFLSFEMKKIVFK